MSEDGGAFGSHLRACRRAAGLSQQELAERAGLSIRTIGNLERGASKWPYRDSLHRLADALGLRDEARAEFIAAAGRRLAAEAAPGGTSPAGARQAGRARVVAAHLPATVPAFVGRRDQLATLSQVLQQPGGTAVITAIGGTAGVGKTALAVHWAHQVAGEFPDGQLYVNLRGFDPSGTPVTPDEAVRVLLDSLGVPAEQRPQTVEAQLGLYRSLLAGQTDAGPARQRQGRGTGAAAAARRPHLPCHRHQPQPAHRAGGHRGRPPAAAGRADRP